MSKKLTKWFPAHVRPVRDGVYQVRPPSWGVEWLAEYRRGVWLGTCGSYREPDYVSEFGREHGPSTIPELEWRGLAKEPK